MICSGNKTLEHALKEVENSNDPEAQGQTDLTLTSKDGDFKEKSPGMKDGKIDSSDEENEAKEYYIADNRSHASLELSDDERMYHHLSDVEDDGKDVSCCGGCDQCILGHYGCCTVRSTVRQRGKECEQVSNDSGDESEEPVKQEEEEEEEESGSEWEYSSHSDGESECSTEKGSDGESTSGDESDEKNKQTHKQGKETQKVTIAISGLQGGGQTCRGIQRRQRRRRRRAASLEAL